jgi:hypothetical protein
MRESRYLLQRLGFLTWFRTQDPSYWEMVRQCAPDTGEQQPWEVKIEKLAMLHFVSPRYEMLKSSTDIDFQSLATLHASLPVAFCKLSHILCKHMKG